MKRTEQLAEEAQWQQQCLLRQSEALSPEEAAAVDREIAADPVRERYAREASATTRMGRVLLPDDGPSDEVLAAIQQAAEQATASRRRLHFSLLTVRHLAIAASLLALAGMSLRFLPQGGHETPAERETLDARWFLAAVSDELAEAQGADAGTHEDEDAMAQQLLEWQGFTMESGVDAQEEWLTPLLPLLPEDSPTTLRERSIRATREATRG